MPAPATIAAEGLLLVDKPAGITSHDVVAVARRGLRERRIGHAGTLDPFATGLLVLMVGAATRLMRYAPGEPKVYRAAIRLGVETTTDDATGEPVRSAPAPSQEAVEQGIAALTGALDQLPPAYSAKQVGGVRAYAAARRGETLEVSPARVMVHGWTLLGWRDDLLDVEIRCGAGTYIRALARDLGRLAGSAAHCAELRRTASGPYRVEHAASLDSVRAGEVHLAPPAQIVRHLPSCVASDSDAQRIVRGQTIPAPSGVVAGDVAVLDEAGTLVAVGEIVGGHVQPRVVLRAA